MRDRAGLLFSSAAHAAVLAYAFIGLGSAKPFEVGPTEALPIEIMSPQEFDAMTKGSKTSKSVDTPKVKAEKVAEADPDPTDDLPIKKEDVKAPPPPKADPAPPKPEPKPEVETARLDAEKAEKAEAEKAAKAEAAEAEKAEAAKAAAAKAEVAKAAAEKVAKEKAEKLAQAETAEAELRAKAEAEKAAKEKAEKLAKAEAEKAAKEKAEAEKAAKLAAEKAAKEKAEKLAKAEAEKAAKEKALAEKKAAERKFDPNKIASLLASEKSSSSSDTALKDVREAGRKERAAREAAPETTAGTSRGTATKLSMSERTGIDNAVREQVSQCWSPPIGGVAGESMIVRVKFTLNSDGSLSGQPSVDSMGASRAAADAALRAVRRCSPLKLPAEAYDYWRSVDIRFDPKDMMGG